MNKALAAIVVLCIAVSGAVAQTVSGLDDILNWTGSGTNRSALVLQWNDGLNPVSLAWGYRWNGSATGVDLLTAIAGTTIIREPGGGNIIASLGGAERSLMLTIERYSWGDAVYSMTYTGHGMARTQADWGSGYWEYSVFAGLFEYPAYDENWNLIGTNSYSAAGSALYSDVQWLSSPIGASARELVDGSWDAYSFAPAFVAQSVAQPFAAPPAVPALSCRIIAGNAHVSFKSEPGLIYTLLGSDRMDGMWGPLGSAVAGDGGDVVFVDELPADPMQRPPSRFYRVAVTR